MQGNKGKPLVRSFVFSTKRDTRIVFRDTRGFCFLYIEISFLYVVCIIANKGHAVVISYIKQKRFSSGYFSPDFQKKGRPLTRQFRPDLEP